MRSPEELAEFLDQYARQALGDDYIDSEDFDDLRESAAALRKLSALKDAVDGLLKVYNSL